MSLFQLITSGAGCYRACPAAFGGPERVQLCAQGLILRENGYLCEGGILYFVESRRRVSIPFDEALIDRTRDLLRQMRQMATTQVMPPPLEDSPKCPRCSLAGICLPDETCLLKEQHEHDAGRIRRLMPARDDALPLYIQEQGVTLGKSGDVLTVKRRQDVIQSVKLKDVSQVSVLGNVQVTAQALREISAAGIPLCHFSYGGWFHAMTTGLVHKNVELRMANSARLPIRYHRCGLRGRSCWARSAIAGLCCGGTWLTTAVTR